MRYFVAPVLVAATGLLFATTGLAAGRAIHTVVMDNTRFEPENITVKAGDTVVWVNKDFFPHTATAQSGNFDSKSVAPGKSWKFTPRKPGVYPYFCVFHPSMKGTLRVE